MTTENAAPECPPHHWQITLLRLAAGLHDHYCCVRCGSEKDVLRDQVSSWSRRSGGRSTGAR
jgi:hypothetical protein